MSIIKRLYEIFNWLKTLFFAIVLFFKTTFINERSPNRVLELPVSNQNPPRGVNCSRQSEINVRTENNLKGGNLRGRQVGIFIHIKIIF